MINNLRPSSVSLFENQEPRRDVISRPPVMAHNPLGNKWVTDHVNGSVWVIGGTVIYIHPIGMVKLHEVPRVISYLCGEGMVTETHIKSRP